MVPKIIPVAVFYVSYLISFLSRIECLYYLRETSVSPLGSRSKYKINILSQDQYIIHFLIRLINLTQYLNVKELFARNRRYIWNLNDYSRTRTHSKFVLKPIIHFDKRAEWLGVYEICGCRFESRCSYLLQNLFTKCIIYDNEIKQ